jgi:4-hydroxy-tetrahydrodipicolinate synthase
MSAPLHGVLPVLHIPYREDEEIAYDVLGAEIDYVYAQGAQGIVFALASEILRLTDEERKRVAGFLVEANQDRGSVTISVGADSTFAALQFAKHAESVGATALMAIPPLSRALSEAELRGYYGAILEAVSLPLVVQDASAYVGKPMSVAFQASLWQEYGDRVLFKPEANPVGPVISALRAATQDRAQIFEGSGGMMLAENYRRGIAGTMPGCDLLDAVVALWCALEEGNEERVYALSPLIASLLVLASGLDGFLVIEKHLMARRGIFKNTHVRGPLSFTLDAATTQEVDRLFDRLQDILKARL